MLSEGGMGGSYRVMSSVQWGWFSHPSGRSISRGGRYVLIIHFYVESGQKLIQFNIQFKIESKIFIQKIIHSNWKNKFKKLFNSKLNQKYSFKLEK